MNRPSVEEIAEIVRKVIARELDKARTNPPDNCESEQVPAYSKPYLVTRDEVIRCAGDAKELVLPRNHVITPLAADTIDELGVKVVVENRRPRVEDNDLIEPIDNAVFWSDSSSRTFADSLSSGVPFGCSHRSIHYPEPIGKLVDEIRSGKQTAGIAVSEKGSELAILLNKYGDVRAVLGDSIDSVVAARERAAANCLVLSTQQTPGHKAENMVRAFLTTQFKNPTYAEIIREILEAERSK
jgi:ribose 5-phosphate isomerase RpiB